MSELAGQRTALLSAAELAKDIKYTKPLTTSWRPPPNLRVLKEETVRAPCPASRRHTHAHTHTRTHTRTLTHTVRSPTRARQQGLQWGGGMTYSGLTPPSSPPDV